MVLVSPTRDTHPRKLCPQGLWGAQWLHTHRTPRPLPHGSDWRVILEGKQGFSQARPEHSRMRKTHAQGGWKGCRVLGERQRGTVSGDGAGRTAGSVRSLLVIKLRTGHHRTGFEEGNWWEEPCFRRLVSGSLQPGAEDAPGAQRAGFDGGPREAACPQGLARSPFPRREAGGRRPFGAVGPRSLFLVPQR